MAVFLSASWCAANRKPDFKDIVITALRSLKQQAAAADADFQAIGVSLDWDAIRGVEYLRSLFHFDQLVAGGNWFNLGAQEFIWANVRAPASIPQLLVIERTVVRGDAGLAVLSQRTVDSVVGIIAIAEEFGPKPAPTSSLKSGRAVGDSPRLVGSKERSGR